MDALDKRQGWKTGEANSPDMVEWMRIAQKRLVLGRHGTYLAQKYLYAVTQTFNGMVFNWAAFVVERIYQELEAKRRTGKISTLLGASYISIAVKYQLQQPMTESDQDLEEERSRLVKEKEREEVTLSVPRAAGQTRASQQPQLQKQKTVVTEASSPRVKRKQTEQRRRSPVARQWGEGCSRAGLDTEQEVRVVSNALQQASKEPGKLKDHIIVGLEQLLDWVKMQTEPNYPALMAELKDVQAQAKRMKADCVVMGKAVTDLRAQKEEVEKERDFHAAEAKRERDRNQINYQTWQEEKKAMEDRMKVIMLEHQRIKDDLDTALLKTLNENTALQEALRAKDHRLEQLEHEKSVMSIGVQEGEEGNMDQESARLRQEIKLLQKQVRDLGEYNEELREKYEPGMEEEMEEETEEEEDEDDGFEVMDHPPSTKVGCASSGKQMETSLTTQEEATPLEAESPVATPTEVQMMGGTTTASDNAGLDPQVQESAVPRDSNDDWLDGIVMAPVPSSVTDVPQEETVAPGTESTPVADSVLAEQAVEQAEDVPAE